MKWFYAFIIALFVGLAVHPAQAQWTNEPSGSSVIYDCPFSGTICGMLSVYNTASYANDATAPLSPNSVFDTFLAANATTGNGQWVYAFANLREIYVSFYWSQNADFEGVAPLANKLLFVMNDGGDANFLNWIQYGGKNTPGTLTWVFQGKDGADNCHVSGYVSPGCSNPANGPGTGNLLPNGPASGTIAAGSGWHKIEIYIKASASTTSRDGTFKSWVDGVLHTNYTNLNISSRGINSVQINHTWDGGPSLTCAVRDCSKAWHHYWDHFHISVPNCPLGCSGGGSGTIDNPAGPPGTTTVTVTVQ